MTTPNQSGNAFYFQAAGSSALVCTIPFWGPFFTNEPDMTVIVGVTVLATDNIPPSVLSVSDTLGLTWTRIGSVSQTGLTNGITGGPVAQTLEFWKAFAPGTPTWTGHVITVTPSSNADSSSVYATRIAFSNLTEPLDQNSGLPASGVRKGSAATFSLTGLNTDTSNILLIGMRCAAGGGNNITSDIFTIDGVAGDFTLSDSNTVGTNPLYASVMGKTLTAALAASVLLSTTVVENTMILAVVFTADTQSAPAVTTSFGVVIS